MPLNKQDTYQGLVAKMAYGGQGIVYLGEDKYVVFVAGALPGQEVSFRLQKIKKNFGEGRLLKVLKKSATHLPAPCPYFGACGGCKMQNLPYEEELNIKREFVKESLEHIGAVLDYELLPIVPSPEVWGYRNKLEFSFGNHPYLRPEEFAITTGVYERFCLGFHGTGLFDKIVDLEECRLADDKTNELYAAVKLWTKKTGIPAYNNRTRSGFWRHLIIRRGRNTGEYLINLVVARQAPANVKELQEDFRRQFGTKVTSLLWTVNSSVSDTAVGEKVNILAGRGHIYESLTVGHHTLRFVISPYSFFQTNSKGAEKLYSKVLEFAEVQDGDKVLDLYCGTGTITQVLASSGGFAFGVESQEEAVRDAKANALLNNLHNVEFLCGAAEKVLPYFLKDNRDISVLVVDPPRAGMHAKAVDSLKLISPRKIVYVSCNPATLARDISLILPLGYKLKRVCPVDMFPHTYHVETVAELVLE